MSALLMIVNDKKYLGILYMHQTNNSLIISFRNCSFTQPYSHKRSCCISPSRNSFYKNFDRFLTDLIPKVNFHVSYIQYILLLSQCVVLTGQCNPSINAHNFNQYLLIAYKMYVILTRFLCIHVSVL